MKEYAAFIASRNVKLGSAGKLAAIRESLATPGIGHCTAMGRRPMRA